MFSCYFTYFCCFLYFFHLYTWIWINCSFIIMKYTHPPTQNLFASEMLKFCLDLRNSITLFAVKIRWQFFFQSFENFVRKYNWIPFILKDVLTGSRILGCQISSPPSIYRYCSIVFWIMWSLMRHQQYCYIYTFICTFIKYT